MHYEDLLFTLPETRFDTGEPSDKLDPTAPILPQLGRRALDISSIELNADFRKAIDLVDGGENVFITGRAGSGKSTLLRYLLAKTDRTVACLAPTGLAAITVGGQTIHSFFRFPPTLIEPDQLRPSRNADLMRRLEMLIIDEISMVRADLMEGVDAALRLNRRTPGRPFGGVQMVIVGDPFQLSPIVRGQELMDYFRRNYGGPYFFQAPALTAAPFHMVDPQKVYRQADTVFLDMLNDIRERRLESDALSMLNKRVVRFTSLKDREGYVTLTPTNEAAFQINMAFLKRLPDPEVAFTATIAGKFDENAYPTDPTLCIRHGARVMMINNHRDKRWVNGTIGIVNALGPNELRVEVDGSTHNVERYTWENVEYSFDWTTNQVKQKVIGTFQQYPIRLAWALTIHKCQGQTFDRVCLDLGRGAFAHGQTYVALSRCTSLEGIALTRPIFPSDVIMDESVCGYRSVFRRSYAE